MVIYAVIMAGGVGSRFWPSSREKTPKQLLNMFGENSLIKDTVTRLKGVVKNENIYVVTNNVQKPEIVKHLPFIPEMNIVAEPFGRNTAACIGLSTIIINDKSEDAVIVTLPADHLITDVEKFRETILTAAEYAYKNDSLVTIGISPTRPETGYGYIQIDKPVDENVFKVKTFAEKPNYETAVLFLKSGDFYWNSGMFIWKASTILNEFKKFMPELYEGLEEIQTRIGAKDFYEKVAHIYGLLKNISIDYGVMEKTSKAYIIKGEFDWSDVGSWEAVYELSIKDRAGNCVVGDSYLINTENSYVDSQNKFTAVIGASRLIIIDTKDALLICDRDRAQEVKLVVDYLKLNKRNELL